ncbi:hypothetical protein AVEN_231462-1 [Araneus ventricosus]|uniref:CCHC-type domain-containing protein n=1 Tax=Araneus ventricosus TaxID=182803 RepID=A0A4Y2VEI5_ARAVE|nr:hypothetical protein AVEN_231462-1 [Araneus ventricosus]
MRLSVRTYIPNPLRCFKCQRFGHSKTSCRGTLTCARCAEVGHESTDCTRVEKCVNCKGEHTSFSRNCFAWKQEKEIISTKIKKQISFQEARKLVQSQTPKPGNSYVSAVKKSTAPSTQTNQDISAESTSKQSVPIPRTPPAITHLSNPSFPSVAPLCEEALASPDLTDFTLVKTKDNISTHQSTLKPFPTTTPTSVDIELLPMAVLPPLEKRLLQSRESDADAEMSSSSASEEDALEYNMSEDLENSPAVISPPPPSKPEKANKNKNRSLCDLIVSDKIFETLERELMTHIAVKQGESFFKLQQLGRECDVYLSSRDRSTKELNRNAVSEAKRVVGNKWPTSKWRADKNVSKIFVSETKNITCVLCKRAYHYLSTCSQFRRLSVWDRAEVVKRNNLCFHCFSPHKLNECRSVENCFCLKPHHRMIHFPRENSGNPASHLKLDAPAFVPKQREESAEANPESQ